MDLTTLLLPVALKGLALAGVVVAACSAFRRARGAVLHAVLAALFGALVALPVLQVAGPAWRVRVPAETSVAPTESILVVDAVPLNAPRSSQPDGDPDGAAAGPATRPEPTRMASASSRRGESGGDVPEAVSPTASVTPTATAAGTTGYVRFASAPASRSISWSWWILCVWGGGAFLVALYWVSALASAVRLVRAARPVTDEAWLEALARAQQSVGHTGAVRLLRSSRLAAPISWGLGPPAVVLPPSADAWDADARAAVLAHEVAHLDRCDLHVQIAAQVALALHWFDPLVWLAYRRLLLERERACDDAALAAGVAPSAYASLLLGVARLARSSTARNGRERLALSAVSSMARPSDLESRIVAVLDTDARRGEGSRGVRMALGLSVLTVLLPLAAFRTVVDEPDAPGAAISGSEAHTGRAEAVSSPVARPETGTSAEAAAMPALLDSPPSRDSSVAASGAEARAALPSSPSARPPSPAVDLPLPSQRPVAPPVPPVPVPPTPPVLPPASSWSDVDQGPRSGGRRRDETPGCRPPKSTIEDAPRARIDR